MSDNLRDRFERWAQAKPREWSILKKLKNRERAEDGPQYYDPKVEAAWQGYCQSGWDFTLHAKVMKVPTTKLVRGLPQELTPTHLMRISEALFRVKDSDSEKDEVIIQRMWSEMRQCLTEEYVEQDTSNPAKFKPAGVKPTGPVVAGYEITYGNVLTIEEWVKAVKCGGFIDHDGHGDLSDGDLKYPAHQVYPSMVADGLFKPPEWATHVVWYNK